MKKSIFTVYVPITEGQEQCDRLKQICIDNGLPITKIYNGFNFENGFFKYFYYSESVKVFQVWNGEVSFYTQVTEAEFIELLKEYKK